jgi:hypothetical protein
VNNNTGSVAVINYVRLAIYSVLPYDAKRWVALFYVNCLELFGINLQLTVLELGEFKFSGG